MVGSVAQSYSHLWKEVETAMREDRPKTALSAVDRIRVLAVNAADEGQLLAASLLSCQLNRDISPDSAATVLRLLDTAAASKTAAADRALWKAATAFVRFSMRGDTASIAFGRRTLHEALADMELLRQKRATDYLPLFVIGKDSRYYDNDLLSVIAANALRSDALSLAARQDIAARLIATYRRAGNREAVLLATLDSINLSGNHWAARDDEARCQALLHTAEEFKDLSLNIETYIALAGLPAGNSETPLLSDSAKLVLAREGLRLYGKEKRAAELRNYILRAEQPLLDLRFNRSTMYPGQPSVLYLTGRNVKTAVLRLYRLGLTAADERLSNLQRRNFKSLPRKLMQTVRHEFAPREAFRPQEDSLVFTLNEPGVYLAELLADGTYIDHALVYMTRVMPLGLASQGETGRIRLLDAMSGKPLMGGTVTEYRHENGKKVRLKVYEADANGEISIPLSSRRQYSKTYYAAVGTDAFLPAFPVYSAGSYRQQGVETVTRIDLFADRAIYRPGQTVRFSGIVSGQTGDDLQAIQGYEAKVRLADSNGKMVEEVLLRTDNYGVLSGEFTLPAACLPGTFSLRTDKFGGYVAFRVEEYKRPTFTVSLDDIADAYQFGDTVCLKGTAKTYTGQPLAACRVKYSVDRRMTYRIYSPEEDAPQTGETVTDSLGTFTVPVVLSYDSETVPQGVFNRVRYTVAVEATAGNGETASVSKVIPAATRAMWLTTDWPGSICKEQQGKATVMKTGVSGQNLGGSVCYTLYDKTGIAVQSGSMESGNAVETAIFNAQKSGLYTLQLAAEGADTVRCPFLLFSEYDTKPAGKEVFWQYVRHSEHRDSAFVMIGSSSEEVTLFYDLFYGGKRMESKVYTFSDSLLHFRLAYKPVMGDGARACFAFVKGGETYSISAEIVKPEPEKKLILQWSSFRSTLVPGQEETWQLRISHPDGTPAKASLMARLYDASLDALVKMPWHFGLNFSRQPGYAYSYSPHSYPLSLSGSRPVKQERVAALAFTDWDSKFLAYRPYGIYSESATGQIRYSGKTMRLRGTNSEVMPMAADMAARKTVADSDGLSHTVQAKLGGGGEENGGDAGAEPLSVVPRTDFSETAFFQPSLRTDSSGVVSITFTLPESLTSWNFTAMAHSREIDFGRLDTTVVARKKFMVQPAMPRFVRRGDRVVVPVTLHNLTEEVMEGTLQMGLIDPETDEVLKTMTRKFSLKAGATVVTNFSFPISYAQPVLVCRTTASAGNYSDGEEHWLPVLSDRVAVSRSVPFSMTEKGTLDLRIDTLWEDKKHAEDRALTVEVSSNPTWYAVTALPSLAENSGESAVGWAMRYYSVVLADRIAALHPEITALFVGAETNAWANILQRNAGLKQTLLAETPWTAEAKTEAERTEALRQLFDPQAVAAGKFTALDRLKALQRADGAWSWYKGMPGNTYITSEVLLLLARLQTICGDESAADCMAKAIGYMDKAMEKEVADMKKVRSVPVINESHLRYLYIRALLDKQPNATAKYLMDRASESPAHINMYGKSLLAVALSRAGRGSEAGKVVESLKEHTVFSPAAGRGFDTGRAVWSWQSSRIPAQTAAIEALQCLPTAENLRYIDEMRLWLMLEKRTQMWETGRVTADAVYALLQESGDNDAVMSLKSPSVPVSYTLKRGRDILAVNAPSEAEGQETAGYFSRSYTGAKTLAATSLIVRKPENGLSWGSVTAQFTLPVASVGQSNSGLSIKRRFEVKQGAVWMPLQEDGKVKTGDVIRQVFTVSADRDYEFVSLKSSRPASLEPRHPLSEVVWLGGTSAYRAVRDASTEFFIERLSKGQHTFTEEYICDRPGRYQCGISRVQSLYAPEFSAHTSGFEIVGE